MDFDLGAIMLGILAAFAVLLVAFAATKLWWWFAFTLALLALLGLFEMLSVRITGLTLSAQYTNLVRRKPIVGAMLHVALGSFFAFLLYHLAVGGP